MTAASDLANVAVGLRRRRRSVDLVTLAGSIRRLISSLGSVSEVARRADVSPGMLLKFLAIDRLNPDVRSLFKNRKMDRVMDAFWLSKVRNGKDQYRLAQSIQRDRLTTHEVRDAVRFINRQHSVSAAIDVIRRGRPRRENLFVVAMPFEGPHDQATVQRLASGLHKAFPKAVIRIDPGLAIVSLDEPSYEQAKKLSKKEGLKLTEFANALRRRGDEDASKS